MIQKTKKLLLNPWFQLVLSVLFVTTSEVFLKRGAVEAPRLPDQVNWTGVSGLAAGSIHDDCSSQFSAGRIEPQGAALERKRSVHGVQGAAQ